MLAQLRPSFLPVTLFAASAVGAVSYAAWRSETKISAQAEAPNTPALDPNDWRSFKCTGKTQLTHNTYSLRFQFSDAQQPSGLFVASCLVARAPILNPTKGEPEMIVRPYTPITAVDARGYMDLVVKAYPAGKLSKHIGELKVGDTLEMKGPIKKIDYQPNMKKQIGMVAGGSGLTPMMQVADAIVRNPADKTDVKLVFANVSEDDIIAKADLDKWAAAHSNFKVYYVVDKPKWGGVFWKGGVGRVTKDMLKAQLPPPGPDTLIMVCGPPGMMQAVSGPKTPDYKQGPVDGILKELGYTEDMVFKF